MGFEPTRAEHIGLAVQRLNHSATSSDISFWKKHFLAVNLPHINTLVSIEHQRSELRKFDGIWWFVVYLKKAGSIHKRFSKSNESGLVYIWQDWRHKIFLSFFREVHCMKYRIRWANKTFDDMGTLMTFEFFTCNITEMSNLSLSRQILARNQQSFNVLIRLTYQVRFISLWKSHVNRPSWLQIDDKSSFQQICSVHCVPW